MSYTNVVPGKLKLKGKALDVKSGAVKKKKKVQLQTEEALMLLQQQQLALSEGRQEQEVAMVVPGEEGEQEGEGEGNRERQELEDHRTAAEKRYDEQKAKLEMRRLAKTASKSHRQRVEEFNQYLANLSEHYDIPKVGPG